MKLITLKRHERGGTGVISMVAVQDSDIVSILDTSNGVGCYVKYWNNGDPVEWYCGDNFFDLVARINGK